MRGTRSALFGVMLGLIAMAGLFALSTWHSATLHTHTPASVASIAADLDHDASQKIDLDSPLHALAHVAGQWIGAVETAPADLQPLVSDYRWSLANAALLSGVDPSGLLKPPRR